MGYWRDCGCKVMGEFKLVLCAKLKGLFEVGNQVMVVCFDFCVFGCQKAK